MNKLIKYTNYKQKHLAKWDFFYNFAVDLWHILKSPAK